MYMHGITFVMHPICHTVIIVHFTGTPPTWPSCENYLLLNHSYYYMISVTKMINLEILQKFQNVCNEIGIDFNIYKYYPASSNFIFPNLIIIAHLKKIKIIIQFMTDKTIKGHTFVLVPIS